MDNVIDLNLEQRPLDRLEAEQATPKTEYLFTVEEGEILARILRDAEPLFKRFCGCKVTTELKHSVGMALTYVEWCVKQALDREDFALVPIWNGSRMTVDAVKLKKERKSNMTEKRKMVYVASPYTLGNQTINVNYQIDLFGDLYHFGFIPILPLLSHFINIQSPQTYETWLDYDFEIIKRCDALLACRMSERSDGRDREIVFAKEHSIPVFTSIPSLRAG